MRRALFIFLAGIAATLAVQNQIKTEPACAEPVTEKPLIIEYHYPAPDHAEEIGARRLSLADVEQLLLRAPAFPSTKQQGAEQ